MQLSHARRNTSMTIFNTSYCYSYSRWFLSCVFIIYCCLLGSFMYLYHSIMFPSSQVQFNILLCDSIHGITYMGLHSTCDEIDFILFAEIIEYFVIISDWKWMNYILSVKGRWECGRLGIDGVDNVSPAVEKVHASIAFPRVRPEITHEPSYPVNARD